MELIEFAAKRYGFPVRNRSKAGRSVMQNLKDVSAAVRIM